MGLEIKVVLLCLVFLSLIFRNEMAHYILLFFYKLRNRDTTLLHMIRQIELGNEDNAEGLFKKYTNKKVYEIYENHRKKNTSSS